MLRRFPPLLLASGLALVLVAGGIIWFNHSQKPAQRSMTTGTVSSRQPDGASLDLTVNYIVNGSTRTVTGEVDRAAFEWQGSTVWVCYEVGDPGKATLRLPYDPLCNER